MSTSKTGRSVLPPPAPPAATPAAPPAPGFRFPQRWRDAGLILWASSNFLTVFTVFPGSQRPDWNQHRSAGDGSDPNRDVV